MNEQSANVDQTITLEELCRLERHYQRVSDKAETARAARNAAVKAALADGWTHARISGATGLSRGRISQIAKP